MAYIQNSHCIMYLKMRGYCVIEHLSKTSDTHWGEMEILQNKSESECTFLRQIAFYFLNMKICPLKVGEGWDVQGSWVHLRPDLEIVFHTRCLWWLVVVTVISAYKTKCNIVSFLLESKLQHRRQSAAS